jgi:hypothetical protein
VCSEVVDLRDVARPAAISRLFRAGRAVNPGGVSNSALQLHAAPRAVRPTIGRASARSRHCLVGLARRGRPDEGAARCPSAAEVLPALAPDPHGLLVATPAPIGVPPARNRGRSTSDVTSSQPESGADDTEAMSGGRWGHLSRLTESSTRVEVTGTTRYDATPRRHWRQTAQSVRACAAYGQAPAEAGSIDKRESVRERYQGRVPPRRPRRGEHLRSTLRRITVALHEHAERPHSRSSGVHVTPRDSYTTWPRQPMRSVVAMP